MKITSQNTLYFSAKHVDARVPGRSDLSSRKALPSSAKEIDRRFPLSSDTYNFRQYPLDKGQETVVVTARDGRVLGVYENPIQEARTAWEMNPESKKLIYQPAPIKQPEPEVPPEKSAEKKTEANEGVPFRFVSSGSSANESKESKAIKKARMQVDNSKQEEQARERQKLQEELQRQKETKQKAELLKVLLQRAQGNAGAITVIRELSQHSKGIPALQQLKKGNFKASAIWVGYKAAGENIDSFAEILVNRDKALFRAMNKEMNNV